MYFYEVMKKVDEEAVVREFLTFCEASPDITLTEKSIREAINSIKETEPSISETEIIVTEKAEDDDEAYDRAYILDMSDKVTYGMEITPWAEILGCKVDEKSLSRCGCEHFAALVLWEMTWLGFDNEKNQTEAKAWEHNSDE